MQNNKDFESLARELEMHQDYRVLRRLPIKEAYNAPDGKTLKKGVILDTETTGLDYKSDCVIELAMILFEFDPETGRVYRIIETFGALEDPGIPISAESSAVHGITDEMVRGKKFDDAEVARITSDVELVIAHNSRFDRPMIEKRYPLFAKLPWVCSYQEIDWRSEGFGSGALEFLAYRCGIFYDAHRAEMDCRALLDVLQNTGTDGAPFLKRLISRIIETDVRLWALNAPFDRKDTLKERGYKWNAENPKAWGITVPKGIAKSEVEWLHEHMYDWKKVTIRYDILDAMTRFTDRVAKTKDYLLNRLVAE